MDKLDEYMEMLYTVGKTEKEREIGLRHQEEGTAMILKLCRDVMNLEQIIQNQTVMQALTRILQEEFKKSVDLTFNILRIFIAFSNFAEMHALMANYTIGALTVKAVQYEIKRAEHRETERLEREKELNDELAKAKQENITEYPKILEKIRKTKEKEAIKYKQLTRKQDKVLFVAFYILLNLAEDITVEQKMIKKSLIPNLIAMLSRTFDDLLILTVTFLKKLSVIGENKNTMKELNIIELLAKFIPCSSDPLMNITLRLLFNLSFDKEIREQMMKCGYVPKLINLLKSHSNLRGKVLKILYHLSIDDRCKSMITYIADGLPLLMGMVINFPQPILPKELAALMINLSLNGRNVEMMVSNKGLNLLMDRLSDKRDMYTLKIIRNISLWTFNQQQEMENPELNYKYRGLWSPHFKLILSMVAEPNIDHDYLVELFGILANMTLLDIPVSMSWPKIMREYNLLNMFCKMLVPGLVQNDLLLEMVMLIAAIASDPQACNVMASSTLIGLLYQLWKEKSDDVELLLQLIHCFHKLFLHKEAREEAMYSTRIVVDIIDCLGHKSAAIRSKAEKLTDIVLEFDRKNTGEPGQLGKEIIKKRFESYNKVWLSNNLSYSDYNSSNNNSMGNSNDNYYGGNSIMRSNAQEDFNMQNSAKYFNDKLDSSMDWKMESKYDNGNYYSNSNSNNVRGSNNSSSNTRTGGGYNGYGGNDGYHHDDDDDDYNNNHSHNNGGSVYTGPNGPGDYRAMYNHNNSNSNNNNGYYDDEDYRGGSNGDSWQQRNNNSSGYK